MAASTGWKPFLWPFLLILVIINAVLVSAHFGPPKYDDLNRVSVVYDEESGFQIVPGKITSENVANGEFTDSRTAYGWTFLTVSTNETYSDYKQAYAAGLVEGYLTHNITAQHWNNTVRGYCDSKDSSPYCSRLHNFLDTNLEYVYKQIAASAKTDPFWHQVELYLYQLNGLQDGLKKMPSTPKITVDPFGLYLIQISGDLEDLEVVLNKTESERKRVLGSGSCSALVKLLPGNKELFVAQDTWSTYQSMLRIIKRYDFNYHMLDEPKSAPVAGNYMLFSSNPGSLFSGDDFYMIGSGLTTMETTIGNSNPDLNKYITPEGTVLEFLRNQVANRLATDGASWSRIFSMHNSGTYNNEWMIIDYNKFQPGMKELPAGVLTVLEQLPGMIAWEDVTSVLTNQTYWASYNSPYFKDIFNASGTQAMVDKYGDWFTYDKTPRAKIFRRDHQSVTNVTSMLKLMRYNDYKNDPLSECKCSPPYSAENAISARSDLNPINGTYPFSALGHRSHGGIDSKITSAAMFKEFSMMAVCGPTHDDQPPFSWSTSDFGPTTPHEGHPDLFDFGPITTNW